MCRPKERVELRSRHDAFRDGGDLVQQRRQPVWLRVHWATALIERIARENTGWGTNLRQPAAGDSNGSNPSLVRVDFQSVDRVSQDEAVIIDPSPLRARHASLCNRLTPLGPRSFSSSVPSSDEETEDNDDG